MDRTLIKIHDSYITLGQFLKLADIISSGGMAKPFLQQMEVFVNDEPENRRGKKLYNQDIISIPNIGEYQIKSSNETLP
ncbi:S4 domain protein YaaA [Atopostipes suicloacalis DSM 15692]|uniref:S4 domain protein YaaA n=1 Tax=Atopostipes suicloacalis DSM 15692 TaxID=1121025 RepID=A0A1M4X6R6_9LACT|nr:S4 domain-containing protein YaaA [Atopostipes suicloacalis]SHE89063.1 S4 domain protein YaaA [Atopostipes suicloacalis DSM 15692]